MPIDTNELDMKLEEILKKIGLDDITLESTMDDIPDWDSFRHIQLIDAIEEEFKIEIEFNDAIIMTSIPIIKKKIMNYL
tara:strand:- start:273 stop:509 length:237 start_codon:yes stop_codon:yes gene_type:complete